MEDLVPFKVYTFWTEKGKPEVRRFGIEKSVVTSFQYLNAKLQDVFPALKGKSYSITWKDDDGDDVTISSDEEIIVALGSIRDDIVKIYVFCKEDVQEPECEVYVAGFPGTAEDDFAKHYGIACDGCDVDVVGFRYKCTSCVNFDLCPRCEASGMHPEHCMVRIPTPSMPREVIKAAIKRSRHFLKTIPPVLGDCPYKRHKRDKSGDRKHHGDRHHGDQHHRRRPRGSWFETFAAYMNEFANLAGDVDFETRKEEKKPKETTSHQKPPKEQENHKTNTQAPQPEPSTSAGPQVETSIPVDPPLQCPIMPPHLDLGNIAKLVELYLSGNLGAFMPQPVSPINDVEMGQGDRGTSDTVSNKSGESESNATVKSDSSPEKNDDWTMINKEKDLMDTNPSAPSVDPTPPIGFNLPQEFHERVTIGEGGKKSSNNLYPPLNAATAVLNPKEAESRNEPPPTQAPAKSQPTAPNEQKTAPQATAATAPPKPSQSAPAPPKPTQATQPTQQPRQRHPMAHIDAAIQQMLAMGFTNDGGWLTQLLESKDGNIAAVLDLLTPVGPRK